MFMQDNDRFFGNTKQGILKNNIFYIIHHKTGTYLSIEHKGSTQESDDDEDSLNIDPNLSFRKPILNSVID